MRIVFDTSVWMAEIRSRRGASLAALAQFAEPVPIFFRLRPNLRDEGDNFVFECAAHFGADYIVTHNVHDFLSPQVRGYQAEPLRPGEFLEMLKKENR